MSWYLIEHSSPIQLPPALLGLQFPEFLCQKDSLWKFRELQIPTLYEILLHKTQNQFHSLCCLHSDVRICLFVPPSPSPATNNNNKLKDIEEREFLKIGEHLSFFRTNFKAASMDHKEGSELISALAPSLQLGSLSHVTVQGMFKCFVGQRGQIASRLARVKPTEKSCQHFIHYL